MTAFCHTAFEMGVPSALRMLDMLLHMYEEDIDDITESAIMKLMIVRQLENDSKPTTLQFDLDDDTDEATRRVCGLITATSQAHALRDHQLAASFLHGAEVDDKRLATMWCMLHIQAALCKAHALCREAGLQLDS